MSGTFMPQCDTECVLSPRMDEATGFRVLFVCTGNICRSPIAERTAQALLDKTLGPAAAYLQLESAGTHALVGHEVHPHSSHVIRALGGDASGFAARQLTDQMAVRADLTLALTRSHRHAVLKRAPRGLSRTFTLVEAADLVSSVPLHADLPGTTFADRCRSLVREMAEARSRRRSDVKDDIADPIGEPAAFHEDVGGIIAHAIVRIFGRFVELSGAVPALDRVPDASAAYFLSGR